MLGAAFPPPAVLHQKKQVGGWTRDRKIGGLSYKMLGVSNGVLSKDRFDRAKSSQ
jgi:hypothetical protein